MKSLGWALSQYDWRPYKRKRSCDDRGKDWIDAAESQGTPGTHSQHQKLERGKKGFCSDAQREGALLSPWFWISSPQKCKENIFMCFKPPQMVVLCCGGPRKRIHVLRSTLNRVPARLLLYFPFFYKTPDCQSNSHNLVSLTNFAQSSVLYERK